MKSVNVTGVQPGSKVGQLFISVGLAVLCLGGTLWVATAPPATASGSADAAHPTPQTSATLETEILVAINDPNCDDANPGTEEAPLCSIQEAANRVVSGTTVWVKEGVYHELVTVTASGAPSALIKFLNYENDHVVIDSPGDACFDLRGVEYLKIHGFELTGAWLPQPGVTSTWEVTPGHGGGIRGFPPNADPESFGVQNSVFTYNVIHDNGSNSGIWLVYSHHNLIANNVLYHNGEAPIRIKRGHHNEIYNNLAFDNGMCEGWGITFYCANGTRVYHNTVVERSGGAVYIYEGTSNLNGTLPGTLGFCIPSSNTQVYDNVGVVGSAMLTETAPLVIGSSTTTDRDPLLETLYGPLSNTYHHNLWYNQSITDAIVSWGDPAERDTFAYYARLSLEEFQHKQTGYGHGSLVADPLFVDPAQWDFRLSDGSPGQGAASDGSDMGVNWEALPSFEVGPYPPCSFDAYLPAILNNGEP